MELGGMRGHRFKATNTGGLAGSANAIYLSLGSPLNPSIAKSQHPDFVFVAGEAFTERTWSLIENFTSG